MKKIKSLSSLLIVFSLFTISCSKKTKQGGGEIKKTANQPGPVAEEAFVHQANEEAFVALLKKVKENVAINLQGYQTATIVDGAKLAVGNLKRNSTLDVNLEKKKFTLRVQDVPAKDGNGRSTRLRNGSLTTVVYSDNGKVWVKQNFSADPVANWSMPVNVVGDTLTAPASVFKYTDMSKDAVKARENDLTYNLKKRVQQAGFSETSSTRYAFVFGLDLEKQGIYFDRQVTAITDGETDEEGNVDLKDVKVRFTLTQKKLPAVEE